METLRRKFLFLLLSLSSFQDGNLTRNALCLEILCLETITKIAWRACARHAFEIRETICQYDRCKDKAKKRFNHS